MRNSMSGVASKEHMLVDRLHCLVNLLMKMKLIIQSTKRNWMLISNIKRLKSILKVKGKEMIKLR